MDNPDLFARLREAEIPIMRSARAVMRSLKAVHDYAARPRGRDWPFAPQMRPDLVQLLTGHSGVLPQEIAVKLLQAVGIATGEEYLATSADEARQIWSKIGGTSVMKIASPDIPHRSDHGLVRMDVGDQETAATVYEGLVERALAVAPAGTVDGVIVQRQVPAGTELLIGTTLDPVLGPAVTVGFGGVLAEIFADTAVRPLPLSTTDAREMLSSLRGRSILDGARNATPANIDAVIDAIEAVATLVQACDGRLSELDINPLIVTADGVIAVDVLAVATEQVATEEKENAYVDV